MSSKSTPLRYVGEGAFIIGVPARDLTAAEARKHRKLIEGSPLYEPVEPAETGANDAPAAVEEAGETGSEGE